MRILVSSCLLGEDTRYDGLNSSIKSTIDFIYPTFDEKTKTGRRWCFSRKKQKE